MTITLPERRSISRKRWRQIEHIAQFANTAAERGYTVDGLTGALRGDPAVIITREPPLDKIDDLVRSHRNVGPMDVEWAYWKITKAVPHDAPNDVWKMLNRLADAAALSGLMFCDVVESAAVTLQGVRRASSLLSIAVDDWTISMLSSRQRRRFGG